MEQIRNLSKYLHYSNIRIAPILEKKRRGKIEVCQGVKKPIRSRMAQSVLAVPVNSRTADRSGILRKVPATPEENP
jgi:hypothetical protein